ncbi:MAG: hypothetical protein BWY19_01126 [bacterium ADurb.Bin212]|nr:MAG: hypothetical protein BWY19_01126 [bacterium ADurb.Bin212]
MKRVSYREEKENIDRILSNCFKTANETDDAEFIASLIKHANLSPWDDRNALKNFEQLFRFVGEATLSGNFSGEDLMRISLLLYCHFFEWSEMFNLFYDLSKISKGERAGNTIQSSNENRDLYWKELNNLTKGDINDEKIINARALIAKLDNGQIGINKKINTIKDSNEELGAILEDLFNGVLRNGFSHNSYSFKDEGILIINEANSTETVIVWDEVNRLYNLTKFFAGCLIEKWKEYLSNTSGKLLKGKYCEYKITYGDNQKFKIEPIKGSIPIGIYY